MPNYVTASGSKNIHDQLTHLGAQGIYQSGGVPDSTTQHAVLDASKPLRVSSKYCAHNYCMTNLFPSQSVRMAAKFEAFVRSDQRFEIPFVRHLGMVVFRLVGDNELTEKLLKKLNSSGQVHCVPASLKGIYVIRLDIMGLIHIWKFKFKFKIMQLQLLLIEVFGLVVVRKLKNQAQNAYNPKLKVN